jgi:hypothetical protein
MSTNFVDASDPAYAIEPPTTTTQHNKYRVEQLLTLWLAQSLSGQECAPPSATDDIMATQPTFLGLYDYCDRGPSLTPILLDHQHLVPVHNHQYPDKISLPCRWHSQSGQRITSLPQLSELATDKEQSCSIRQTRNSNHNECTTESIQKEIHLYAVPAGRLFVFAPSYVGQVFDLSYLMDPSDYSQKEVQPITLTVLSLSPRVFDIHNAFSEEEAAALVTRALAETSPTHKLSRSTTGTLARDTSATRTSENAFDAQGAVAVRLKQRIIQILGMDGHVQREWKGHDDGLQILRYNVTTAYAPHLDYLQDSPASAFNYDSSGTGGNRFATVLLYMSDVTMGGETAFTNTEATRTLEEALVDLRASGDAERAGIVQDSWEEELVADCRRHLAIQPRKSRAVLFYSQHPNGQVDQSSLHAGCPVLEGEKWAANLWVWNTPRRDHAGAPLKSGYSKDTRRLAANVPAQLTANFINSGKDPAFQVAELWYDEGLYWGPMGHGDPPLQFNTYQGHRWNIRVDGKVVKKFVIGEDEYQEFVI